MTELHTVTIPAAEELLRRLTAIDNEPHLMERFYPLLMPLAGQRQTGEGIALALALAVRDYTKEMPRVMSVVMYMQMQNFLPAFTDDHDTLEAACALLSTMGMHEVRKEN